IFSVECGAAASDYLPYPDGGRLCARPVCVQGRDRIFAIHRAFGGPAAYSCLRVNGIQRLEIDASGLLAISGRGRHAFERSVLAVDHCSRDRHSTDGSLPVRLNSTSTWRAVGLLLTFNSLALAHAGEPLQPHDLWTAWEFDPRIVVPLVISGALYLIGIRRTTGIRRSEVACFWAGWLTLVIALISPVHPLGEALFSAHMVQHELLMVIAPPLLVLGRPVVVFLWALPFKWRRRLGRAMKRPSPQLMWGALTAPFGAWLIHAIVLWGWHAPPLFQATLTSDLVHSAQHISFLGSALLFWWALLRDMRYGAG